MASLGRSASAQFGHDIVVVNATSLLLFALAAAGGSFRPFSADIAVRVPAGNLRRPDVTVFCQPYNFDAMVSDQPRLVFEVLSNSTRGTDQHQKLDEYKGLISLEYIILIAPHDVDALVWSRQHDRSWVSHRYRVPGRLASHCPRSAATWRWPTSMRVPKSGRQGPGWFPGSAAAVTSVGEKTVFNTDFTDYGHGLHGQEASWTQRRDTISRKAEQPPHASFRVPAADRKIEVAISVTQWRLPGYLAHPLVIRAVLVAI